MECDGSCILNACFGQVIPCEDGEILYFYFCIHERVWILATYAPPKEAERTPRS